MKSKNVVKQVVPSKVVATVKKYPAGTDRIRDQLSNLGFVVTLEKAEALWRAYSAKQGESWLGLPVKGDELLKTIYNGIVPDIVKGK